jgi:hypothetical protein
VSPWERLLDQPHPGGHFVQLYKTDESELVKNVGRYLWEGLRRGDGVLVVATPAHEQLFLRKLQLVGADTRAWIESKQLIFLDAEETLRQFLVDHQPDWLGFERVVGSAIRQVQPTNHSRGLRAYGEMVGILWKARRYAAAIRLEQLWNRLLESSSFSLFCGYSIDVFGKDFNADLDSVLCTHTHVIPAQTDAKLEIALNRSMDEVLGPKAEALRATIKPSRRSSWAVMPNAESTLLWLRKNLPDDADRIVERTQHHYLALSQPAESVYPA